MSSYDKKDERYTREVMPAKNFTLTKLLELLYNTQNTKNNILEMDSDLERSMTIFQGIKKMLAPCAKLHYKKKSKKSTVQTTLTIFERNKTNF